MTASRAGNDTTSPPGPPTHVRDDDYDALAELFLGAPSDTPRLRLLRHDEQDAPASAEPVRRAPALEALVLGHLPVLSGPWVAQYARHVSDTRAESVALLRVYGEQASIDLFSNRDAGGTNPSETLDDALRRIQPLANRWIIRVDPTNEPTLAASPSVWSVTLLCGADDAAVVAAYQTIKRLAADPAIVTAHNGSASGHDRAYRVVIIGSAPERARAAAEKIRRATSAFLSLDVPVEQGPAQVGPTRGLTVYRGAAPANVEQFARRVASERAESRMRQPAPEHALHQQSLSHDEPADSVGWQGPNPADPVPVAGSGPFTQQQALWERVAGLTPLDARCPYAPQVELACDASSRLHMLTALAPDACQQFEVAAVWALDHAPILTRLARRAVLADRPARHVFTDAPAAARRLLDSRVRVHLLASVIVEGRQGWFCTPLNDPDNAPGA